jgi:CDP-diacylglycerol--serine O-phosphatidyltransferase
VYVEGLPPILGGLFSFIPILFGTIRLAKFNLNQDQNPRSYFVGLPTPMNAVMIITFLLFNHQIWGNYGDPRIALVMTAFLGFLMVSKIRFSKFPLISFKKGKSNTLSLIGVSLIILSALFLQGLILFPLFTVYILWSIIQWTLDNDRFEQKSNIEAKL